MKKRRMAEINVVPYIDVMLVLLVIFMVATPFLSQGFEVQLPSVKAAPTISAEDPLTVTVAADGSYYLELDSESQKVASAETIAERLRLLRERNPDLPVLVRGDRKVHYGAVAKLLGAARAAGVNEIGLVTEAIDLDEDN